MDENSEIQLTMKVDAKKSGSLEVETPGINDRRRVTAIPLDFFGDEEKAKYFADVVGLKEKTMEEAAFFDTLRPGKYRVVCGDLETVATVKRNDVVTVILK